MGSMPHGFTWVLVLLKDLSKTSNTVWYFHVQILKENWGEVNNIYDVVNNEITAINKFKA
jgi:hypothetical protein